MSLSLEDEWQTFIKGQTEMISMLEQLPPNGCRVLSLFAEVKGAGGGVVISQK